MADSTFRDLIVVQAGPGSGKSAFTLRLANELMERGFFPIVVRFRDLRLATFPEIGQLIDDAIRIGHTDDDSPPGEGIVASVLKTEHELGAAKLCRAVFILDGWDEVSLTGNVSYQAQLREWLPRLRQYFIDRRGTPPVRVVLTGRPSAEVGQSGVLHKMTPIFTLRPRQDARHPALHRRPRGSVRPLQVAMARVSTTSRLGALAPWHFEAIKRTRDGLSPARKKQAGPPV